MALSEKTKKSVLNIIFDRAYEIEKKLWADDRYYAKLAGVPADKISEVALITAVKEIQKEFKKFILAVFV